jgi:thiamine biosynthesis lipoprotein
MTTAGTPSRFRASHGSSRGVTATAALSMLAAAGLGGAPAPYPAAAAYPTAPAAAVSPVDSLRRFAFAERHMGSPFRVLVFAPDSAAAAEGAEAAFDVIGRLDRLLSDYDPDSELSRLGEVAGRAGGREVSRELLDALHTARSWAERTNGAFDPTIGPLTRLWRWSSRRGALPDSARLARARAAVGWRALEVDRAARRVRLTRPGMALDLGGIAKGYAADAALAALARLGLRSALVDAGGDIAVGDPPPGEAGWRVAVDGGAVAEGTAGEAPAAPLVLARVGVATSGDAYRFIEVDGVRYSHIVDPRTGLGVTRPDAVTVIAPDATTADVLASALSVLDGTEGRRLMASVPGARIVEAPGTITFTTEHEP